MWRWLIVGMIVIAVGGGGAATPPVASAQNQGRIAVVDVERVILRSAAGAAVREQLEREKATMQKEVDAKRVELEKLKEELDKKGPLMTVDARKEKQDSFERKRRDAARLVDDLQKELQKKEYGMFQKMSQEVVGVIDRLGKQRNYALIVDRRAVVFYGVESDITDEIIRVYDQEAASKAKK